MYYPKVTYNSLAQGVQQLHMHQLHQAGEVHHLVAQRHQSCKEYKCEVWTVTTSQATAAMAGVCLSVKHAGDSCCSPCWYLPHLPLTPHTCVDHVERKHDGVLLLLPVHVLPGLLLWVLLAQQLNQELHDVSSGLDAVLAQADGLQGGQQGG